MSNFMTVLALLSYGTAAVVGMQLIAAVALRLYGLVAHRGGRLASAGQGLEAQQLAADVVLLAVGLFLLAQGTLVVLWTFG